MKNVVPDRQKSMKNSEKRFFVSKKNKKKVQNDKK